MEKVINQKGEVAVVYSPGYGSGWYTWNQECPEMMFDPNIVHYLETKEYQKLEVYVELKYSGAYLGGIGTLEIKWIPEGTLFRIQEYDGAESIEIRDELNWLIA
jgi:hypothetical protein